MEADGEVLAAGHLVAAVRAVFPGEASAIDARLVQDGFEPGEAPHIWLEHFSQHTTDALKSGNTSLAEAQLKLMSRLLAGADEPTTRCIDVAYVEALMWDIKDVKLKRESWKLIPANLRRLYVAMWGEQPFM